VFVEVANPSFVKHKSRQVLRSKEQQIKLNVVKLTILKVKAPKK